MKLCCFGGEQACYTKSVGYFIQNGVYWQRADPCRLSTDDHSLATECLNPENATSFQISSDRIAVDKSWTTLVSVLSASPPLGWKEFLVPDLA